MEAYAARVACSKRHLESPFHSRNLAAKELIAIRKLKGSIGAEEVRTILGQDQECSRYDDRYQKLKPGLAEYLRRRSKAGVKDQMVIPTGQVLSKNLRILRSFVSRKKPARMETPERSEEVRTAAKAAPDAHEEKADYGDVSEVEERSKKKERRRKKQDKGKERKGISRKRQGISPQWRLLPERGLKNRSRLLAASDSN